MTSSVDEILNGPDYFYCLHYKARMKKSCCIRRQAYRDDTRVRQNPNRALALNLVIDGCFNCAQGAEIKEEMLMASKRGVCVECGKERSLPANGKCWTCNGYSYKKAEKKRPVDLPAEMSADKVKRLEDIKMKLQARIRRSAAPVKDLTTTELPDPLPIAKIENEGTSILTPNPRIILLDFNLPENEHLYEPWLKYSRSHRRGPGDQAMMAVEEILTGEGMI
jgi:flagellar motor switch/type III secretory pathway protein FliN